ncbi:MAG: 50S ribosomal protein L29 [Candidatus Omnitrophica bacterium]|nr:50S ribosomal protein L29 [Candidatus Omnitrophota bacterium]
MKAIELRNMTEAEIEHTARTLREKYFELRAEFATGRIERPHRLGQMKKDLARCYTILKEKKSGK